MPRNTREQIVGAEVPANQRQAAVTDVVASPVNTMVAPPDNEFAQLAKGLASVHEPLARLMDNQQKSAELTGRMRAAQAPDASTADGAEIAMGDIPTAYRPGAVDAYSAGIGERLGVDAKQAFLAGYLQDAHKPDFNFDQYAAKFRAEHLNGLGNLHLVLGASKHIDEAIALAKGDYRQLQQKQLNADNASMLSSSLSEISPGREPEANAQQALASIEAYRNRGGTRAEGASFLLQHVIGLSDKFGGRPELFDIFDSVDPSTKLSIAQMNPALADNIGAARLAAEQHLDKNLFEQGLQTRSLQAVDLERGLAEGRFDTMTQEKLWSEVVHPNLGKNGLFNTDREGAALMHRVFERQGKVAELMRQREAVSGGKAALVMTPAQQHERLTELAGPELDVILKGLNDPAQSEQVNAALRTIVRHTAAGGFDVALPGIKQLMGSLMNSIPGDKATTPPAFAAAARFYQDLKGSNNPHLVAAYFSDENQRAVMEDYLRNTANGQVPSDEAYRSAYAVASPEARARAKDMMKDPATSTQARANAREAVVGFFRRHTPWGKALGVEPDVSFLQQGAESEAQRYLLKYPWKGADDALEHVKDWAANNSYHDTGTNAVIEVPQVLNSPVAQEALSDWLGMVGKAWTKGDNKVVPRLQHKAGGIYSLALESKNGIRTQSDVDLRDIIAVYQAKKNISGDEFRQLGEIRGKVLRGEFTPQDAADNAQLIQKANDLDALPGIQQKVMNLRTQGLTRAPSVALDKAMVGAESTYKVPSSAALREPDANSLPVAKQFLDKGDYAGALTAMGERVRLVAYKDPARGMNIGLGYNMTVNAKELPEDFRKAGIPTEYIDEIKAGKRAITVEQATRLYDAVRPRYEAIAKKGMEKQFSGEWDKLPQNAQAVLTDLAYQTGNIGQFEKGLARLKDGDFSGAGLQASFIDRGTQQRRVDERRHALRVAMLKNVTSFQTLLNYAAKQPASPIEARAVSAGAPS